MTIRSMGRVPAAAAALLCFLAGCGPPLPTASTAHEDLDAAAWVQTSAEYRAIAWQTYGLALEKLKQAQQDRNWSALPTQQRPLQELPDDEPPDDELPDEDPGLPPAVILDVDETVLDNSAFQVELIRAGGEYAPDLWNTWAARAAAGAVPGAATFIQSCRDLGVEVLFVTNRENAIEQATRSNLEQLGMIDPDAPDLILSKNERDAWGSDKTPRREFLARHYRILLIVGDDLNDFAWAGQQPTAEARRQVAEEFAAYWGQKWFLLPNPNYGGWERALYDFNDNLPRADKLQRKRQQLSTTR